MCCSYDGGLDDGHGGTSEVGRWVSSAEISTIICQSRLPTITMYCLVLKTHKVLDQHFSLSIKKKKLFGLKGIFGSLVRRMVVAFWIASM